MDNCMKNFYRDYISDLLKEEKKSQTDVVQFKDCVMIDLSNEKSILEFIKNIPDDILYVDEPGYGKENWPHVTVLYGLGSENLNNVRSILKDTKPFKIKLGHISKFRNENFDVIKIDVYSENLNDLNKKISTLPNQNKYPTYKAHITLAYVKPGKGEEFVGNETFNGRVLNANKVIYSDAENKHTVAKILKESGYGGHAGGPTSLGLFKIDQTPNVPVPTTMGSGFRSQDGNTIRNSAPYDTLLDSDLDVPGIDRDELRVGIRHEMLVSPTRDKNQAKEKAIKNLKKDPKYYSLLKMYFENSGKLEESSETKFLKKFFNRMRLNEMTEHEKRMSAVSEIIKDLQDERNKNSWSVNNQANLHFQDKLKTSRENVTEIGNIIREMQSNRKK